LRSAEWLVVEKGAADANVRRVAETVARLDPGGEDILVVVGSDCAEYR
jgi:predicted HAD superfamily phosphohydrolase